MLRVDRIVMADNKKRELLEKDVVLLEDLLVELEKLSPKISESIIDKIFKDMYSEILLHTYDKRHRLVEQLYKLIGERPPKNKCISGKIL